MGWKKAIVVGASSGLGAELCRLLVADNAKVVGIARREERLRSLEEELGGAFLPLVHDVTDFAQTAEIFDQACKLLGGLDLIIYCAGVMPSVELDEFNSLKDGAMIDVNCLGAVMYLNLAAQRFQGVGGGTIVGIGSVAGDRGRKGQPVYNASKAFLATYLEALRNRLSEKGVTVVTIKPGPLETEMTAHLTDIKKMPVKEAAKLVLKKSTKEGEHYLSFAHRVIFAVIRLIPGFIFRKLSL